MEEKKNQDNKGSISQADELKKFAELKEQGIITEEEYVENRTITDEAKEIFNKMDKNRDGILTEQEFIDNSEILNHDLAQKIFRQLDINGEGHLSLPTYLKVWGNWARED